MTYRLRSGTFDTFFDTGWGWAISIGFVTAIAALIVGSVVARLSGQLIRCRSVGWRPTYARPAGRNERAIEVARDASTDRRCAGVDRANCYGFSEVCLVTLG
jgi:hypothetical protein